MTSVAPFVPAGVAVGTFPISPDRALVQHRVPHAQLEPVLEHRALPAGIDDDLGPDLFAPRRPPSGSSRRRPDRRRRAPPARAPAGGPRRRARGRCRASSGRTRCGSPARSASTRAACCPRSRTAPTACPAALTNCTLYFLTKGLAFILSSMFSRLNTQYVSGISDSPMWKRGNCSRSNSRTLNPALGEQGGDRAARRTAADHDHVGGLSAHRKNSKSEANRNVRTIESQRQLLSASS